MVSSWSCSEDYFPHLRMPAAMPYKLSGKEFRRGEEKGNCIPSERNSGKQGHGIGFREHSQRLSYRL